MQKGKSKKSQQYGEALKLSNLDQLNIVMLSDFSEDSACSVKRVFSLKEKVSLRFRYILHLFKGIEELF